jgi:hypothetical protein
MRLDGAQRKGEQVSYLPVGKLMLIEQNDDQPVLLREATHGLPESLSPLLLNGGAQRVAVWCLELAEHLLVVNHTQLCPQLATSVEGRVDADAIEPGTELGISAKPWQGTPDTQIDLLRDILRFLTVAQHAVGQTVYSSLGLCYQLGKGGCVPTPTAVYQFAIGVTHWASL